MPKGEPFLPGVFEIAHLQDYITWHREVIPVAVDSVFKTDSVIFVLRIKFFTH